MKNTPYVKEYQNGILSNPITKDRPYKSGRSMKQFKIKSRSTRCGKNMSKA